MTYQLVPPDDHRWNISERAIQTAKSHVVYVLCGVDPNLPMHLWDLLIPKMEIQLNLLPQLRAVPKILAYAHHYGPHNYNAHPLAPLGCAVEYHVKPSTRASWGTHAVSGFYVGVSLEHYQCHRCWIKDTKGVWTGHNVLLKHKHPTMPTIIHDDALLTATSDLRKALDGDIPQSQYDKGMVDKFIATLNANVKNYQNDTVLRQRVHAAKTKEQRVTAATDESGEDVCFDKLESEEASPEADTPAANTRSRVRSGQRSVTQEALTTVLDISGMGYMLTPKITSSRKFPKKFFTEMAAAVLDGDTGMLIEYRHLTKRPKYKAIWRNTFGNEDGRFAQGMPGRILKEKATNTMFFIKQDEIPRNRQRDVTYTNSLQLSWPEEGKRTYAYHHGRGYN